MFYIVYRDEDGPWWLSQFSEVGCWVSHRDEARQFYTRAFAEYVARKLNATSLGLGYSRGPITVREVPMR